MKKVIGIILGILVLILLTIWVYNVLYNKPIVENNNINVEETENSDWLTYRNEEYGFEFRYPEDLSIKYYEEYNTRKDVIVLSADLPWPERGVSLEFQQINESLEGFIKQYNNLDGPDGFSKIFDQEEYYINGMEADLLKGSTAIGIDRYMIFITNDSRNYVITYMEGPIDQEIEILNTFKFVD